MKKLTASIVKFPGSNCENETLEAVKYFNFDAYFISHKETVIDSDLVILPGGFSFGDYVSCGRIAKFSPVILSLKELVKRRKIFILGICNGFQILTEANILPGAILENIGGKFICDDVELTFLNKNFSLPIAHHQGRYYIDNLEDLKNYEIIKYKNNPNGSMANIAGLYDKKRYIMGLMPHPERNVITPFKSKDGKNIFEFIRNTIEKDFYGII